MPLPNKKVYKKFGELRNSIQHSSPPINTDFSLETLKFIYDVIDPFINNCWGLYAVDYHEDSEPYNIVESLLSRRIEFLVPPSLLGLYRDSDFLDDEYDLEYKKIMQERFKIKINKNI
ncbi:hypothetical protein ACWA5Z_01195 [Testudinibacter sp. P80/BLE/0925]|uniref:hypothetical protein n=1 Tax=Testudinibacter sp. TW-1 TaxID=3417757 RepID=UPI003D36F2BB